MEYFAKWYEGTNDDGYKHNFFTFLRVPLIFHFLLPATDASPLFSCFNIFHFSLFFRITPWLNGHAMSIIVHRSFPFFF